VHALRTRKRISIRRIRRFFLINLSHESLENYFKVNYQLLQNFNYSLHDIEHMLPWEREIYLTLLISDLKEQNEKAKQNGNIG
jgi:hypothetical protein